MKYTFQIHYTANWMIFPDGNSLVAEEDPEVFHAKCNSEKEAIAWAERLVNLPNVRGGVLSGKLGKKSFAKVYVVSRKLA